MSSTFQSEWARYAGTSDSSTWDFESDTLGELADWDLVSPTGEELAARPLTVTDLPEARVVAELNRTAGEGRVLILRVGSLRLVNGRPSDLLERLPGGPYQALLYPPLGTKLFVTLTWLPGPAMSPYGMEDAVLSIRDLADCARRRQFHVVISTPTTALAWFELIASRDVAETPERKSLRGFTRTRPEHCERATWRTGESEAGSILGIDQRHSTLEHRLLEIFYKEGLLNDIKDAGFGWAMTEEMIDAALGLVVNDVLPDNWLKAARATLDNSGLSEGLDIKGLLVLALHAKDPAFASLLRIAGNSTFEVPPSDFDELLKINPKILGIHGLSRHSSAPELRPPVLRDVVLGTHLASRFVEAHARDLSQAIARANRHELSTAIQCVRSLLDAVRGASDLEDDTLLGQWKAIEERLWWYLTYPPAEGSRSPHPMRAQRLLATLCLEEPFNDGPGLELIKTDIRELHRSRSYGDLLHIAGHYSPELKRLIDSLDSDLDERDERGSLDQREGDGRPRVASAVVFHEPEDRAYVRALEDWLGRRGIVVRQATEELVEEFRRGTLLAIFWFSSEASTTNQVQHALSALFQDETVPQENMLPLFDVCQANFHGFPSDIVAWLSTAEPLSNREVQHVSHVIAEFVYSRLEAGRKVAICLDQRGLGKRRGLPPLNLPASAGDRGMPTFVFRPDSGNRGPNDVVSTQAWRSWAGELAASWRKLFVHTTGLQPSICITGESQLALPALLGVHFSEYGPFPLAVYHKKKSSTLGDVRCGQPRLEAGREPNGHCQVIDESNCFPRTPNESWFSSESTSRSVPHISLLLVVRDDVNEILRRIELVQESPPPVWVNVEEYGYTSTFGEFGQIKESNARCLIDDVGALLRRLEVREVCLYTHLPWNVMPFLAAAVSLRRRKLWLMEPQYEKAGAGPVDRYVAVPLQYPFGSTRVEERY